MAERGQAMKRRAGRFRARAEAIYNRHGRAFHVGWTVAAFVILLGGLAMTVFPGPAVIVIPLGLAMLSVQFAWASRLIDVTVDRGADAADAVSRASTRRKILLAAALLCFAGAVAAFIVLR